MKEENPQFAIRILQSLRDPRIFQSVFQGLLLATGLIFRNFSITLTQVVLCFLGGAISQYLFVRAYRLKEVGYISAFITCFGLCLFLRADSLWVHPLAAVVSIASKFLIRANGKHIFNPSNFGAVVALLFLPHAWLSTGQWGNHFLMSAWAIALGSIVVIRAQRNDISWSFLGFYLGALAFRIMWYDQSWRILLHHINGSLLVFTFFMISDPMTIPNQRKGRWLHAGLVALAAYLLQYVFYQFNASIWSPEGARMTELTAFREYHVNGLLLSLFLLSPLVVLWDRIWPAAKYKWSAPRAV